MKKILLIAALCGGCAAKKPIISDEPVVVERPAANYVVTQDIRLDARVLSEFGPDKGKELYEIVSKFDLDGDGAISSQEANVLHQIADTYRKLRSYYQ